MRRTLLSTALSLLASGALFAADPPPNIARVPAAPPTPVPAPVATVQTTPAPTPAATGNCRPNPVKRFFFGDRSLAGPRPIIIDGDYRYEPKIRDIRYAPSSSTLPGTGLGAPDTINVVPSYQCGYFRLFHTR